MLKTKSKQASDSMNNLLCRTSGQHQPPRLHIFVKSFAGFSAFVVFQAELLTEKGLSDESTLTLSEQDVQGVKKRERTAFI